MSYSLFYDWAGLVLDRWDNRASTGSESYGYVWRDQVPRTYVRTRSNAYTTGTVLMLGDNINSSVWQW